MNIIQTLVCLFKKEAVSSENLNRKSVCVCVCMCVHVCVLCMCVHVSSCVCVELSSMSNVFLNYCAPY